MFETPNLDGLTTDPKDLYETERVLLVLATYARRKARAMEDRLSGDVGHAMVVERDLERIYQTLPQWARW